MLRLSKEQIEQKYHELRKDGWSPRVAIAKLKDGRKQTEAEGRVLSIESCLQDYINFFLSKNCIPLKNRDTFVANLLFKAWRYKFRSVPKKNKPRTLRYKRIDRERNASRRLAMSASLNVRNHQVEPLKLEQSNHSAV